MSRNFEWSDRAFLDLSLLNKGGSSLSDDAFDLLVTTACDDIAKIQVLGDAANSLQRLQGKWDSTYPLLFMVELNYLRCYFYHFIANKKFKDVDHEWLNKIYHCLSMFLLKCASANLQVDETVEFLTRFNWSSQQVKNFKKIYTEQLENIQVALKVIGKDPPEIVDVNWRLDYQLEVPCPCLLPSQTTNPLTIETC